jgi:hypothetical protein
MFLKHLKIFSVMLNIFKNVEIFLKHWNFFRNGKESIQKVVW